jgi:transposase
MLVEAAGSVGRMKGANYLSAQHARLTTRRGMSRAAVAVAHSMLVSAYSCCSVTSPTPTWVPTGWLAATTPPTRRLVAELERLGHTVILDPVA